jgi:LDH2 family malate/lactate/ureidoglycolate dehydrogenase
LHCILEKIPCQGILNEIGYTLIELNLGGFFMLHPIEQKLPFKQLSHNSIQAQTAIFRSSVFFGAMQIDGFIDKGEFKKQIDDWIRVFRNTKPAPGTKGPLIPGDPEREAEANRSKEGIPLLKPVVDDLLDISRKTGIPFEVR